MYEWVVLLSGKDLFFSFLSIWKFEIISLQMMHNRLLSLFAVCIQRFVQRIGPMDTVHRQQQIFHDSLFN